jgi:hypothetical protein
LDDGDHGDDELHDVEDYREEDHVDHSYPSVSAGQVVFGFLVHGWGLLCGWRHDTKEPGPVKIET